jgi:hypothetical protein
VTARVMTATTTFDWFQLRIEDARVAGVANVSDDTALYLSTLLSERTRADRPVPGEQTLAELHLRAANAPPVEQARTYRELGDRALYLLGYFSESLRRRTVGPKYYAEMGAAAYHRADRVFKERYADAFGDVFHEMALQFVDCVRLIRKARDAQVVEDEDSLPFLYDRWLATGSDVYAEKLRGLGLVLPRSGDSTPDT